MAVYRDTAAEPSNTAVADQPIVALTDTKVPRRRRRRRLADTRSDINRDVNPRSRRRQAPEQQPPVTRSIQKKRKAETGEPAPAARKVRFHEPEPKPGGQKRKAEDESNEPEEKRFKVGPSATQALCKF